MSGMAIVARERGAKVRFASLGQLPEQGASERARHGLPKTV